MKDHYCIKYCDKCGNEEYHKLRNKIHEELELFETARQTPINKDVASHQDRVIQILKSLLENEK